MSNIMLLAKWLGFEEGCLCLAGVADSVPRLETIEKCAPSGESSGRSTKTAQREKILSPDTSSIGRPTERLLRSGFLVR